MRRGAFRSFKKPLSALLVTYALWGCAAPAMSPSQRGSVLDVETESLLPKEVKETSGLALVGGKLWTMNDSGGAPALYQFDQSYSFEKRVKVQGIKNVDWESLAKNDTHLFIADCGNNKGKRKALDIYRVPLVNLIKAGHKGHVNAFRIHFKYADYTPEKAGGAYSTNYDCEAITVIDDQIWLFSKNWGDLQTRIYTLDPDVSKQTVQPLDTWPVGGMITGADYDHKSGRLALLGYSKVSAFGYSFIWIVPINQGLPDWKGARYHQLNRYAQWEGIAWDTDGSLLLTSEKSPLSGPEVGRVHLKD
jgi:hypothetical protein